ncbi:MAG TPA: tetratricopeptide repeat protein, partial [Methanomicrobia archaeon]|nr:tetratricopeptide repeat protein [Methanomicrobia archaeon]
MKKKVIILLAMLLFSGIYAQEKVITVKYYFVEGCPYCEVVKSIIDEIEKDYPNIEVERMNVYKSSVWMNEFLSYDFWKVPAIVINEKAKFQGDEEITEESLRRTIDDYLSSYNKGSSFFEKGKSYYEKKEYRKAKIYLEEAKNLFENGNFDTNSTEDMLEDCNSCIEAYDLIFEGDLFLENNDLEKAREMYSQVKCEDLKSTAEEKIDNIDIYEESLQSFNTAVEYYSQKNYSQALSLFKTLENILVGEKQKKCKDY